MLALKIIYLGFFCHSKNVWYCVELSHCGFICICPMGYSEMYCLVSNSGKIFHVSYLLISTLISLWSPKIYFGDYNSSKLLNLSFILVNAPTALKRICISAVFEWSVYKCQLIQLTVWFLKHFWLLFCHYLFC